MNPIFKNLDKRQLEMQDFILYSKARKPYGTNSRVVLGLQDEQSTVRERDNATYPLLLD